MTHGWPGSVIELLETVGPLTDPTAHGGRPRTRSTSCFRPCPGTASPPSPLTSAGTPAAPRSWVEQSYPSLTYFNETDRGGHFAAWEEPELFAGEVRAAFRSLR